MQIVLLLAFAPLAFLGWVRMDNLVDRLTESRPGTRVRRAVARQIGAMIGWYGVYLAATFATLDAPFIAYSPMLSMGLLMIACAAIAKHRNDAPLFWPAP